MNAVYLTIIIYDWLQFARSKVFWILTGLLLLTGMYASFYGRSEVKEQEDKIALLKQDIDSSNAIVAAKFKKQDTIASWHYDDWLYTLHSNKPDNLAGLAFGQRDLHRFAVSLAIGTFFYNRYAGGYENKTLSGEIGNPQKRAIGHLDVSFVLVFLLPLYLILISYNCLSAEQEAGTISLLALQKISLQKLLIIKMLLRFAVSFAAGCIIIFIGLVVNGALYDPGQFYFFAGTAAYCICWSAVILLIISFFCSSGANALSLISLWLFFCFAIPAAFTAILDVSNPLSAKSDLTAAVQKANARVFNTSRRSLSVQFYKAYPHYNVVAKDTFPGGWYNPRWMRAVHRLLDDEVKPLEDKYRRSLQSRITSADKLDYFSPALLAQGVFDRTTAGDMAQLNNYDGSIYNHYAAWRDSLDHYTYLRGDRLNRSGFNHLPRADFTAVIDYNAINHRLLILIVIAALCFAISIAVFNRYSNFKKL